MNEYRVRKARPIAADVRVPGDKSISHRAVLIAALANGPSVITGFLPAAECLCTVQACRALGVKIDFLSSDDSDIPWLPDEKAAAPGPTRLRVHGKSMNLTAPVAAVDCGSSRTALSLLSGVLAGQSFVARLIADEAASHQSMHQIVEPLDAMGASVKATGRDKTPPLIISGHSPLKAIHYAHPVATAEARDAVLFAGLFAAGKTTVTQASTIHNHTERILRHYQVKTVRAGPAVSIYGGQFPESRDFEVPGDLSCAANWIVAAAAQPGSELTIRGVGLNETRSGFLRILVRMGAQVLEDIHHGAPDEPRGNVIVRGAPLHGTVIAENEVAALDDELPILAVAASLATGSTLIHETPGEGERCAHIAHNLRLMGVEVSSRHHRIEIKGSAGAPLQPGCVPSHGDRRVAMACAIAGLFTEGETIIENIACVESAYPGFHDELKRFQSRGISGGAHTPFIAPVPRDVKRDALDR
jgi:3-phosphoshikimate 1-carboxyvinyltransferase